PAALLHSRAQGRPAMGSISAGLVPGQGRGPASPFRQGRAVPDSERPIPAGGGKPVTVRAERQGSEILRVPPKGEDLLARLQLPDPQGHVRAAGDEALTVGTEHESLDAVGGPTEDGQFPAGLQVRHLDRVAQTDPGQALAVGTELKIAYPPGWF